MQLLTNHNTADHSKIIRSLISDANEIIICVAFLKSSGLKLILRELKNKKKNNCTFYFGTDFFLTEPKAIRELSSLGFNIYRTKHATATFHPKLYYFRKSNTIKAIIGSSNLTSGGLESNFELSCLFETERNSTIDASLKKIIHNYLRYSQDFADEMLISQYEGEYNRYRQKHKKADKEFKEETNKIHTLDFSQLPSFVREYRADSLAMKSFRKRKSKYNFAKDLINNIISRTNISKKQFLDYYTEIGKSFYSSGLLRGKKTMADGYKKIISIFKITQKNYKAPPKQLFNMVLPIVRKTERYGVNAATELMNTYNPQKYSVANGRTLQSLADLGFPKFPNANSFDAETYERYNNLIIAIALKCKFSDLGQVDHFLSWYYTHYVE